ncbi:MAG: hypothetical protein Q4F95_02700 [Oscillospiraceae bacterium]|nr:hypothetical protein [Oscillospiraceae bacterium]
MNYDKLRESVMKIKMPDDMKRDIISETSTSVTIKKRKKGYRLIKPAAAFAAAVLCVSVTVPVLAAKYDPVYEAMYSIAPAAAQFFRPVNMSCEDNGIRMEVVSADVHDSTAQIYITMQDLTGDRIDSSVDLYDSYDINTPFDSTGNCTIVNYDEDTKTATFLITVEHMHNKKIKGDKLTFSVGKFLSNKIVYEGTEIPYSLSDIESVSQTQEVDWTGCSGPEIERMFDGQLSGREKFTALIPYEPYADFPVQGIEFTGMGYIDGRLHIQIMIRDHLKNDNHGYFYFTDSDGIKQDESYDFSFVKYIGDERVDYNEYVFDVSPEELSGYTLKCNFWTCDTLTEGDWSVTFPIK